MGLTEFTPIAVLGLMAYVGTTITKYVLDVLGLTLKKAAPLLTLVIVYVWSFAMLWLISATRWAGELRVGDGDTTLAVLSIAELLVVAFFAMAVAVGLDKLIKARDMTQTAATPSLAQPTEVADSATGPGVPQSPPDNLGVYFEPGPNP